MITSVTFRKTLAILGIALGFAAFACVLPENAYQRWQLLDGTIHARAKWIYERIHFDLTPIDIVFVGPSRTEAGVNAPRIGAALAARGLPSNVVNFSLPETGRNINYAVIEEMMQQKQPRLIVLGVIEKPSRFGHSAFKYLASPLTVANPGYIGNFNYLSDLVYLPFRQMRLFAADVAPEAAGIPKQFDSARYRGHSVDTTGDVLLPDGTIKEGKRPASLAELERGVRKLEAETHPPILPSALADLEFGDERHYLTLIANLARSKGVRVAFLFLPYYTGPVQVQEQAFYERFGPVWNAGFLATHSELYADYGHLTQSGAERLSDWLIARIATMFDSTGALR